MSRTRANLWLIEPNDEAVCADAEQTDGVWHVSALQAYLDLKDHPERADEAAVELKRRWLNPEVTSGPREAL